MQHALEVTHLSKIGSDYSPMFLSCKPNATPIRKAFRFLHFWTKHPSFKDVVKENQQADFEANSFTMFNYKLKKLKKALSLWSKSTYGDIFQIIAILEGVVVIYGSQFELNPTQQNRERLQNIQAELIKYLAVEELFWQQKSGMKWFQDGDRNTKFFLAQMTGIRRSLKLSRIQNNDGQWVEGNEEMAVEEVKFFEVQFKDERLQTDFWIMIISLL